MLKQRRANASPKQTATSHDAMSICTKVYVNYEQGLDSDQSTHDLVIRVYFNRAIVLDCQAACCWIQSIQMSIWDKRACWYFRNLWWACRHWSEFLMSGDNPAWEVAAAMSGRRWNSLQSWCSDFPVCCKWTRTLASEKEMSLRAAHTSWIETSLWPSCRRNNAREISRSKLVSSVYAARIMTYFWLQPNTAHNMFSSEVILRVVKLSKRGWWTMHSQTSSMLMPRFRKFCSLFCNSSVLYARRYGLVFATFFRSSWLKSNADLNQARHEDTCVTWMVTMTG